MAENDRYMENRETVHKIASQFGLVLTAFDPAWRFSVLKKGTVDSISVETVNRSSYDIDDDFMGKLALLMGYDWVFESWNTGEELTQKIKQIEKSIESHPFKESMEIPPISQEMYDKYQDKQEEFDKINTTSHDLNENALQQHITYCTDLKEQYLKALDVRDNLRNWRRDAID